MHSAMCVESDGRINRNKQAERVANKMPCMRPASLSQREMHAYSKYLSQGEMWNLHFYLSQNGYGCSGMGDNETITQPQPTLISGKWEFN